MDTLIPDMARNIKSENCFIFNLKILEQLDLLWYALDTSIEREYTDALAAVLYLPWHPPTIFQVLKNRQVLSKRVQP